MTMAQMLVDGQTPMTDEQILSIGIPPDPVEGTPGPEPAQGKGAPPPLAETPKVAETPAGNAETQPETNAAPPGWAMDLQEKIQRQNNQLGWAMRQLERLEKQGAAVPSELLDGVRTIIAKDESDRLAMMSAEELAGHYKAQAEAAEAKVRQQPEAPGPPTDDELSTWATNHFHNAKLPVLEAEATRLKFSLTAEQRADLENTPIFKNAQTGAVDALAIEQWGLDLNRKLYSYIPEAKEPEPSPAVKAGAALGTGTKPSGLPTPQPTSIFDRGGFDIAEELAKIGM